MSNNNRERDLVLAPNEFAFISDQTKGNVITYVGPYKTSMANTDQPVFFNKHSKRFDLCPLEDSIRTFATAPEGWYIILKNPAENEEQPQVGTSNTLSKLNIGRKINLPGPRFFALWPGQMAQIIAGHHLRSNEYLVVRVYEEELARKNWNNAVLRPQNTTPENIEDNVTGGNVEVDPNGLTMGQLLIIEGINASFYIPPTGLEVVKDYDGSYVRKAVTLERLEYCILLDEDGNKRYITGPAVVFPRPTERFVEKNGSRKFKAIELDENTGIYVKVIAPYEEDGTQYKVGNELFITGKEQMIYFPRPEHALVKYGEQETYHAVAIPHGEGRYCLNRNTGKITLAKGPSMFLPDPREAVIIRRILSPKQVRLWFPGNEEAVQYNMKLQEISDRQQKKKAAPSAKGKKHPPMQQQALADWELQEESAVEGVFGNSFSREEKLTESRTVVLDNKYEGAVTIDLWTGYAVLITSKTGKRKVLAGPITYLLEYDEFLQGIELSTGTPKTDDKLLKTVYLRALNNKVSDCVTAETKDFCDIDIKLSYRVNFTGDPENWFNVENYVKFLTDHLRSVIRNALRQYSVHEFYANGISIIRDIVLGKRNEEENKRSGWVFEENGMHIYEVEVLDIQIKDKEIEKLLFQDKHNQIRQTLKLANKKQELDYVREAENISREIAEAEAETRRKNIALAKTEAEKELELNLTKADAEFKLQQEELMAMLKEQEQQLEINRQKLAKDRETQDLQVDMSQKLMDQRLQQLKAEVQAVVDKAAAVSPDLIAALQAYGDKALAEKMAETMAPLSIIGGKSVVDVFANLVKGTRLEKIIKVASQQLENESSNDE